MTEQELKTEVTKMCEISLDTGVASEKTRWIRLVNEFVELCLRNSKAHVFLNEHGSSMAWLNAAILLNKLSENLTKMPEG